MEKHQQQNFFKNDEHHLLITFSISKFGIGLIF